MSDLTEAVTLYLVYVMVSNSDTAKLLVRNQSWPYSCPYNKEIVFCESCAFSRL
jgi:hypothetical protein